MESSALWFRHGLRLHDNPSLHEAIKDRDRLFYPIFIFDGESAGTKLCGYNRMKFLTECLEDLDKQFRKYGGQLFVFENKPEVVFKALNKHYNLKLLCFEQDCEPVWRVRDENVKRLCDKRGVKWMECVSHTLWDPFRVIEENGGTPPLTYQAFLYVVSNIGNPPRPVDDVNWQGIKFGIISPEIAAELKMFPKVPTAEDLGFTREAPNEIRMFRWIGGETQALKLLQNRLAIEKSAFDGGYFLPNQANPDLLGAPTSQSAALRFGCLSVRRFYWNLQDVFKTVHGGNLPPSPHITGQLIWREYFYTMSVNNEYYAEMERNPICLNIPWSEPKQEDLNRWKYGKTGFPFIDAVMRQLLLEGWVHHVARNAVACFLTRGDLWISWEYGLHHFFKYLLDADWSVCAGNWMWVSSSAFEQVLDCSECVCPIAFGRRLDPGGEYVKRYLPELRSLPSEYLYEPWKAPIDVQERSNCIIGKDYPPPIVDHTAASKRNKYFMQTLREQIMGGGNTPPHCRPSDENEAKSFLGLPSQCHEHCLIQI